MLHPKIANLKQTICLNSGLWIRIHFFCGSGSSSFSQCGSGSSCFLNVDPDPSIKKVVKNLMKSFFVVEKNIKDCSKVRNNGACANLLNKFELTCNYYQFPCLFQFLFEIFLENVCGSMRIRIHRPALNKETASRDFECPNYFNQPTSTVACFTVSIYGLIYPLCSILHKIANINFEENLILRKIASQLI